MPEEFEDRRETLQTDLNKIIEHFTTDRYPKTAATQHRYEQMLNALESRYGEMLSSLNLGEREAFDKCHGGYLSAKQAAERNADPAVKSHLSRDDWAYRNALQHLTETQVARGDEIHDAVREANKNLNEHFGFADRSRDRDDDHNKR
jgi:hypothetical protein